MAGVKQLNRNWRAGCEGTVCSPPPSCYCLPFREETARFPFRRKARAPSCVGGLGAVHGPGLPPLLREDAEEIAAPQGRHTPLSGEGVLCPRWPHQGRGEGGDTRSVLGAG